jgi:endoglucanase
MLFESRLLLIFSGLLSVAIGLDPAFVKVNGYDLRDNSGYGEVLQLRGVNIGGWLVQEQWMCPTSNPSPYGNIWQEAVDLQLRTRFNISVKNMLVDTYQANWITTNDLDAMQAMGFNFVRLPFSFLQFMEEEDSSIALGSISWKADAVAFKYIDWFITEASKRKIYVLLDFHEVQGKPIDPYANPTSFWAISAFQDRAVEIWKRVAARYAQNPWVIGYDLLNEPWSTAVSYYSRVINAIRPIDPDHIIFVEVWGWLNMPDLTQPSYKNWTNVVCSLHWYPDRTKLSTEMQYLINTAYNSSTSTKVKVPIHLGEWYINGGNSSENIAAVRLFSQLGFSWNKWTFKTTTVSGWGTYQRAFDASDPLNSSYTPNLYDNSTGYNSSTAIATINSQWARWKTPNHTDWNHLDSSNRLWTAGPIANGETLTVPSSGTFAIPDSVLLANDWSLSSIATFSVVNFSLPSQGTFYTINGLKYFVAPTGFTGTVMATYKVLDSSLNFTSVQRATLSLVVNQSSSGTAPCANSDQFTTHKEGSLKVTGSGVLNNDVDILGRSLSAILVSGCSSGTLDLKTDGSLTYTPNTGFTGYDSFTYSAQADGVSSAPATVTITVIAYLPTNANGLLGMYANGSSFSPSLWTNRTDSFINFTYDGTASPIAGITPTYFCTRWIGQIIAEITGNYTFTLTSDDAIRMQFNGSSAYTINDWSAHGSRDAVGYFYLQGGVATRIVVDYVQYGGGGVAKMAWSGPATNFKSVVVPPTNLLLTSQQPIFPAVSPDVYTFPAANTGTGSPTIGPTTAPTATGSKKKGDNMTTVIIAASASAGGILLIGSIALIAIKMKKRSILATSAPVRTNQI